MEILPQMLAILAVFALLGVTLWWLRRNGAVQFRSVLPPRFAGPRGRSQTRFLGRIEALQLTPSHSLSLIRVADRAILIGTSPAGIHLIESTPWKTLEDYARTSEP